MKVEYISPFAEAALSVISTLLGAKPDRGSLTVRPQIFTTQQINVVLGVTGHIEGMVIMGMSMITADKIASKMIGQPVVTFDQLAASAIAELANMISGNSLGILSNKGYICDITPPTIIRGSNVKISSLDIPAITIPLLMSEFGDVEINVSLKERHRMAAA
jgi:chemotaxis protein CheX